jgi:hypothetical protein
MNWTTKKLEGVMYRGLERTCLTAGRPSDYASKKKRKELTYFLLFRLTDRTYHIKMDDIERSRPDKGSSVLKRVLSIDGLKEWLAERFSKQKGYIGGELFVGHDGIGSGPASPFLASIFASLGVLRAQKSNKGDYYIYSMGEWTRVHELFKTCPPPIDAKTIKVPKLKSDSGDMTS